MKNRISGAMLWIVALLFVAQSTSAQAQSFEGRVIQTITIPMLGDEKIEMVMNIKGENMMIAMDMGPNGQAKMFSQNGGKSMVMVLESMKMGYELNLEEAFKQASTTEPAITATGKKETVNGYAAEEWTADVENGAKMVMWLTSDIDKSLVRAMQTAMKAQNAQRPSAAQAEITRMLTEKGMIAVRTIVTTGEDIATTIDLVKIEKASIPDATFIIPSDIKVQKMPTGATD